VSTQATPDCAAPALEAAGACWEILKELTPDAQRTTLALLQTLVGAEAQPQPSKMAGGERPKASPKAKGPAAVKASKTPSPSSGAGKPAIPPTAKGVWKEGASPQVKTGGRSPSPTKSAPASSPQPEKQEQGNVPLLFDSLETAKQYEMLKLELKALKAQLAIERRKNADQELPPNHSLVIKVKQHLEDMNTLRGPKGNRKYGSSAQASGGSQRQSSQAASHAGSSQSAEPTPATLSV